MATVIDSLLVKLGIDSSDFNKGKSKLDKDLKDTGVQADKTGATLNKMGRDGSEGFESVAKSATKFLALLGGTIAIKRFIQQTVESSSALYRLSQNLGQSATVISAWSNAAEIAGGSASGLQGSMDMLSQAQTEIQLTGQSALIPYFSALGVSMADVNGKARSANDIFLDLSDRFSRMNRTTANNMGRMMGFDQGTINLLLKGRAEVELMLDRQKKYNLLTDEQSEKLNRLDQSMIETRQSFDAFGRQLLISATPALQGLFSALLDFGNWLRQNQDIVQAFLSTIAIGLAAIAASSIPINLTIAAVTSLAAAIGLLYDDYKVWKNGGESLIDWKKWGPGIEMAMKAISAIRDGIKDLFYTVVYQGVAIGNIVSSIFKGDWRGVKLAAKEFMNGPRSDEMPSFLDKMTGSPSTKLAPGAAAKDAAAMAYFQSQGWTKEQAAGLVANINRESGMRADAVGDGGRAYGIAQWHPDRQAEFARLFGKPMQGSSVEEQLAFMHYELTRGNEIAAGNKLRKASTAYDAAASVSMNYERPANRNSEASLRGGMAMALLNGIPGASNAAAGAASPMMAQNTSNSVSKSVQTHIGEVKIYSAATDAKGIAKDMGKSMDYLFTSQANYGLT